MKAGYEQTETQTGNTADNKPVNKPDNKGTCHNGKKPDGVATAILDQYYASMKKVTVH